MSRQLLAKNLLRFGAKGLTESKMFKFLFEQDDLAAQLARWRSREDSRKALDLAFAKTRKKGVSVFTRDFEYVPITESAKKVKINFYNNFVTIDDGTSNPDEARAQINAVIQEFKNAGANLDDPKTEITIRSGATPSKASTVPGTDGVKAGKKQIDHTYYLKGDDWKEKFKILQSRNDQWGNERLARQRGENVRDEMKAAGVKATINVKWQTNADERFVSIEGKTLGTNKVVTLTDPPKIKVDISRKLVVNLFNPTGRAYGSGVSATLSGSTQYFRGVINEWEAQVRQYNLQRMTNKQPNLTQEEINQKMPPEVVKAYWLRQLQGAVTLEMSLQFNVNVSYIQQMGRSSTGSTSTSQSAKWMPRGAGQFSLPYNPFDNTHWPLQLKKVKTGSHQYDTEDVHFRGRGWTNLVGVSNFPEEFNQCATLIKCTGHFNAKASKKIDQDLRIIGSSLVDSIFGTNIVNTMNNLPRVGKNIAISGYENAANLPLPSVETYPRLKEAHGAQELRAMQAIKDESAALFAKFKIGKTVLLDESKTLDAAGLATAAAAAGIQGASAQTQYSPAYWTGGYFIDLTEKQENGLFKAPIPLSEAPQEIWNEIQQASTE